ncbi:2-keto-4-pentenoate hydratase/2-oxohepta-3-ene-1,7-dioic acid hydratase in catechol pathway [Nocardioides albertanoniae]|uniref:2-keto-4-pentenoate hydratase/2-oxohepta-3-ene-1,7-dioic acid hydratase in catechol pathway n=1 Tax=Nocardioides albertanoniae TaxID=1175486 RepID=A0A543AD96_9ACTN|nr:fumarylacetoacetate hydrolase family protein [Nocardioides albertanoniae]TQL70552.1 2-keto-4-pentenoate hydratase/2-oxohepta-3-ene-1,7-dioic acid hydratase in catechol pathway [Nocardioides albertanoniae]
MRLLSVGPTGHERPAALDDHDVLRDLSATVAAIDGELLGDPERLDQMRHAIASGDLPAVPAGTRTGPPVPRPGKIVGIGLNYEDHAEEAGLTIPDEPVVFLKPSTSIVGPYDTIELPPGSTTTDYEVELGVVVGRRLTRCGSREEALSAVGGYLVGNDVSERSRIAAGPTWAKGKCADTFTPIGPWLVTPDDVVDPQSLGLELWVGGERRQRGTTARMARGVGELLAYVSSLMTLEPGDLLLTGTPGGVAAGRPEPKPFLSHGDIVEAAVAGLGRQRTPVDAYAGAAS